MAAEQLNAQQEIAKLSAQLRARTAAEEQLRYLADHDDLTGLLNRRALIAHLDARLAEARPDPVAILFLDLDRFKVVNDHIGQDAGDRFIKTFAELLRAATDVPSVIARFGGNGFVVVPAAPMDVDSVEAFGQRLQNRVQQPLVIDGESYSRTVSIGVAAGVPGRDSSSDLLRRVEHAMRSAKTSGAGTIRTFNQEMSERYALRNDIELRLQEAIDSDKDAFVVNYLPEFDMRTGEVLGAEALIRWQHPTRGLLMPELFIVVAESLNLARKLGRRVIQSGGAQVSRWRSRGVGTDAVFSYNVSAAQLVGAHSVDRAAAALNLLGLDPGTVCLEITERTLVEDFHTMRKALTGFKGIGVQIAIDDFGTGYSALSYLKRLPVDVLKIDKEFVRDLGTDAGDLAIIRSILALANAFGLDVVAEGVETVAAARTLLELGCHRAQGFLLSHPLDSEAMEALLAKRYVPMDFSDAEGPGSA
jgi:diguanylate cyclase (GGDEF)-like protein